MVQTIKNLENSIHKTNRWINELNKELEWDDKQTSYDALSGTLQIIRDMLTIEEATDFGSQLPLILRGTYYTNWNPSNTPIDLDKSAFVNRVHSHLGTNPDIKPNETAQKVLDFLNKKITKGEITDIKAQLPNDIQNFWET
ncbi:MAG TPA: DUF2267 domain-containing protein [Candidatus Thermoplasmatota archaeon]|nr:DUF2267 domain-containing protein [Candidatus Thermoplasmatota archaeon]